MNTLLDRVVKAAKVLSFQAQITGGVAGPDKDLMRAIEEISPLFAEYDSHPTTPNPVEPGQMVTDAMVEAACKAFDQAIDVMPLNCYGEEDMRAALEAALAASPPRQGMDAKDATIAELGVDLYAARETIECLTARAELAEGKASALASAVIRMHNALHVRVENGSAYGWEIEMVAEYAALAGSDMSQMERACCWLPEATPTPSGGETP